MYTYGGSISIFGKTNKIKSGKGERASEKREGEAEREKEVER